MSLLLSSYKLGSLELKNRIVMPPMCMYSVKDNSGEVSDFHIHHYTARAIGEVGLIIVEATGVVSGGRITNNCLGLWNEKQMLSHKKLVDGVHNFGSKIAIQLNHAGRKSTVKEEIPIAPSNIAFSDEYKTPKEMSLADIEKLKKDFVDAGLRAKEAGYDAIELHVAHGYLLSEFLSPLINQRNDKYGGSLENRCSLIIEIAKLFKEKVKLPLIVRVSADEWVEGGWDVKSTIYLARELKGIIDILHVSSGGLQAVTPKMPIIAPLYQIKYAKEIKDAIKIPVIAVGLITTPSEGEALLLGETCDLVAYGRELLRNPNLANDAAKILKEKEKITLQYQRAY
ncbi:MAG: NADH:flavin oxidoreductase/NADH oxidase [Campylobacteraceae bacterium]